jgi:hypothetical protein
MCSSSAVQCQRLNGGHGCAFAVRVAESLPSRGTQVVFRAGWLFVCSVAVRVTWVTVLGLLLGFGAVRITWLARDSTLGLCQRQVAAHSLPSCANCIPAQSSGCRVWQQFGFSCSVLWLCLGRAVRGPCTTTPLKRSSSVGPLVESCWCGGAAQCGACVRVVPSSLVCVIACRERCCWLCC